MAAVEALVTAAARGDVATVEALIATSTPGLAGQTGPSGSPLHAATRNGHVAVVEKLLQHGANALAQDDDGQTPLHQAVRSDRKEVLQMLVLRGVPVNVPDHEGKTVVHLAAEIGHPDVLLFLFDHLADVSARTHQRWTALHYAAMNNHPSIVLILLQKGINVDAATSDGKTALHLACESGKYDLAQLLVGNGANIHRQDKGGWTPLHYACAVQHADMVEWLASSGALFDLADIEGRTPLHVACLVGRADFVELFINTYSLSCAALKNVATSALLMTCQTMYDVTANPSPSSTAPGGTANYDAVASLLLKHIVDVDPRQRETLQTPLMLAAAAGNARIVQKLLDAGARVDLGDCSGTTALHHATKSGHVAVVVTLLRNYADVNTRDERDRTPLHYACSAGMGALAADLIERGALINAKDFEHNTPLALAVEGRFIELVQILLSLGADPVCRNVHHQMPADLAPDDIATTIQQIFRPVTELRERQLLSIPEAALRQTRPFALRLTNNCLHSACISQLSWAAPALLTGLFLDGNVLFGQIAAKDLTPLKALYCLSLAGCTLSSSDIVGVCQVTSLRTLILSDNALGDLPKELAKLQQLRRLVAAHCSLSNVPSPVFELRALTSIDLRDNPLMQVPHGTAASVRRERPTALLPYLRDLSWEHDKVFASRVMFLGHEGSGKTTLCSVLFPPRGILSKRSPSMVNMLMDVWQDRLCELHGSQLFYSRPVKPGGWERAGVLNLERAKIRFAHDSSNEFHIVCEGESRSYDFKCSTPNKLADWIFALRLRSTWASARSTTVAATTPALPSKGQSWFRLRKYHRSELDEAIARAPTTAPAHISGVVAKQRINRVTEGAKLSVAVCVAGGQHNVSDRVRLFLGNTPSLYIVTWNTNTNSSIRHQMAQGELRHWLGALQRQLYSPNDPVRFSTLVYIVGTHVSDQTDIEKCTQVVLTILKAVNFTLPHRILYINSHNSAQAASLTDTLLADIAMQPYLGEDTPKLYLKLQEAILAEHETFASSQVLLSHAAYTPVPEKPVTLDTFAAPLPSLMNPNGSPITALTRANSTAASSNKSPDGKSSRSNSPGKTPSPQAKPGIIIPTLLTLESMITAVAPSTVTRASVLRGLHFLCSRGNCISIAGRSVIASVDATVTAPEWFLDEVYASTVHCLRTLYKTAATCVTDDARTLPAIITRADQAQADMKPFLIAVQHSYLLSPPFPAVWSVLSEREDRFRNVIDLLCAFELAIPWDMDQPGLREPKCALLEGKSVFPASLPPVPPVFFSWPISLPDVNTTDLVHTVELDGFPLGFDVVLFKRLVCALPGVNLKTSWRWGFHFVQPGREILVTLHADTNRVSARVRGSAYLADVFDLCFGTQSNPGILRTLLQELFPGTRVLNYMIECTCTVCRSEHSWQWNELAARFVAEDKTVDMMGRNELWHDLGWILRPYVYPKEPPHDFALRDVHAALLAQRQQQQPDAVSPSDSLHSPYDAIEHLQCSRSGEAVPIASLVEGLASHTANFADTLCTTAFRKLPSPRKKNENPPKDGLSKSLPPFVSTPRKHTITVLSSYPIATATADPTEEPPLLQSATTLAVMKRTPSTATNGTVILHQQPAHDLVRQLYARLDRVSSTRRSRLDTAILQQAITLTYFDTLLEVLVAICMVGLLVRSGKLSLAELADVTNAQSIGAGAMLVAALTQTLIAALGLSETAQEAVGRFGFLRDFDQTVAMLEDLAEIMCKLRLAPLMTRATNAAAATEVAWVFFNTLIPTAAVRSRLDLNGSDAVRTAQHMAWVDADRLVNIWLRRDPQQVNCYATSKGAVNIFVEDLVLEWQVSQGQEA